MDSYYVQAVLSGKNYRAVTGAEVNCEELQRCKTGFDVREVF